MNIKKFILSVIVVLIISMFLVSCAPPKTGRAGPFPSEEPSAPPKPSQPPPCNPECTPGSKTCGRGPTAHTCVRDAYGCPKWDSGTYCPYGCVGGECQPECGSKTCIAEATAEYMHASRQTAILKAALLVKEKIEKQCADFKCPNTNNCKIKVEEEDNVFVEPPLDSTLCEGSSFSGSETALGKSASKDKARIDAYNVAWKKIEESINPPQGCVPKINITKTVFRYEYHPENIWNEWYAWITIDYEGECVKPSEPCTQYKATAYLKLTFSCEKK